MHQPLFFQGDRLLGLPHDLKKSEHLCRENVRNVSDQNQSFQLLVILALFPNRSGSETQDIQVG